MAKSKKKAAPKPKSSQSKQAKPVAKKVAANKATVKKIVAKKAVAKKVTAKQVVAKKAGTKKVVAKKPAAKKTIAKKPAARKAATPKAVAKKVVAKKPTVTKSAAKRPTPKVVQKPVSKKVTVPAQAGRSVATKAPASSMSSKNVAVTAAVKPSLQKGAASPMKNSASGMMPKVGAKVMNQPMPKQNEMSSSNGAAKRGSKTAPPMRLSVNDSEVIATAKERYGAKDLANFRKLIEEQRAEASEEFDIISEQMLDTSGEFDADNQSYALHTAEQGTDAMEREKTFLHAQRTSDYIKKLDEALERINRGTYGICVICGTLIEKERLAAVPITQKHVDCKNKTQAKKLSIDQVFHEIEEQPVD